VVTWVGVDRSIDQLFVSFKVLIVLVEAVRYHRLLKSRDIITC
jgi:hypothetical protein